jgi:hypothetical protein
MNDLVIVTYVPKGQMTAEHQNFKLIDRQIAVDVSTICLKGGGLLNAQFQATPIESSDGDTRPRTVEYRDLKIGIADHKIVVQAFEKAKTNGGNGKNHGGDRGGKPMRGAHNGASRR